MRFLVAALFAVCLLLPTAALANPVTLTMGRCDTFALMAGTALSANGVQSVVNTGSAGVAPGTALTGNLVVAGGSKQVNSQSAIDCAADELVLYGQLKNAVCTATNTLQASDLAGLTLTPGVYCSSSGLFSISASTLTLDGLGDPNAQFIFQMATSLTTATSTSIILKNGASAANVFWQVGSSASIGYSSSFAGSILAYTSISVDHDASVKGRLFAQAALTFAGGDAVTSTGPASPTGAPSGSEATTAPAATKSGADTMSVASGMVVVLGVISAMAAKTTTMQL